MNPPAAEEFLYLIERLRCYEPEKYMAWEERAAIMEHCGERTREQAEWEAYLIIENERWR